MTLPLVCDISLKDSSKNSAASLCTLQQGDKFIWMPVANKAFTLVKNKMTLAPVFGLLNFEVFDIETNGPNVDVIVFYCKSGGTLVSFFSEKLFHIRK